MTTLPLIRKINGTVYQYYFTHNAAGLKKAKSKDAHVPKTPP